MREDQQDISRLGVMKVLLDITIQRNEDLMADYNALVKRYRELQDAYDELKSEKEQEENK